MNVFKITKDRMDFFEQAEYLLYENIKMKEMYSNLFREQYIKERKDLLFNYINKLDTTNDVFDLAIKMRKHEIVKFYEIMSEELKGVDKKNKYIQSIDIEEHKKNIEEDKKELENLRDLFEKKHKIQQNYPPEISLLIKKIIGSGLVKSQENIIDYKLEKKISYLFNRKLYKLHKNIKKYYEIYQNFELFTDGSNFYNEYLSFTNFEKEIDVISSDIQKIKSNIQMAVSEVDIYEKEFADMKIEFNLSVVKTTVIRKFIEYAHKEKMVDYYIERLEDVFMSQDLYKKRVVSKIKLDFYEELNKSIIQTNKDLLKELNNMKLKFKKVLYASFKNSDLPLFSNVGYFNNAIINTIKTEDKIINMMADKDIIKTEDYNAFIESLEIKTFESTGLYSEKMLPSMFSQVELEKYYSEIDSFVKSFNK